MAMVTIYRSERVSVGCTQYREAKAKAESIAQTMRAQGGHATWQDEYNDYSARGVFTVTARA
jgi:hypothetical protein